MVDISCGSSHSLSLDSAGKIYSWGNGQGGRLGHGREVGENAPRQIMDLKDREVQAIDAGDATSSCMTQEEHVFMWGCGLNGRLGNGNTQNELYPMLSEEIKHLNVLNMKMGTNTSFAILESRKVLAWGSSKNGKLGFPLANGKNYELPKEIIALKDFQIYQIAPGPFHTLLLTIDGKILTMGNSKDGKLGIEIPPLAGVIDVDQPLQIKRAPRFFCFQLAKKITKEYPLFRDYTEGGKLKALIDKPFAFEVTQVKCGESFQLFLTNNGEVYACGSNKFGQLGLEEDSDSEESESSSSEEEEQEDDEPIEGQLPISKKIEKKIKDLERRKDRWEPQQVPIAFNTTIKKVRQVAAGSHHAFALLDYGDGVMAWGRNTFGQLGIGGNKRDQLFAPMRLKTFGQEATVSQIACGEKHSVFLMSNGCVMTCGSN